MRIATILFIEPVQKSGTEELSEPIQGFPPILDGHSPFRRCMADDEVQHIVPPVDQRSAAWVLLAPMLHFASRKGSCFTPLSQPRVAGKYAKVATLNI